MKRIGFIICNGESRRGFNLEMLRPYGRIYGCNALYRDFRPDVLFAGEQKVIDEITAAGYDGAKSFRLPGDKRVNLDWGYPSSKQILDDEGWACGPTAALLMCQFWEVDIVFLVACDLFSKTGLHNNVYKGTDCYRPADGGKGQPTDPINFINQFRSVFVRFPDIKFYRVTYPDLPHPRDWYDNSNVWSITYREMLQMIKRSKIAKQ